MHVLINALMFRTAALNVNLRAVQLITNVPRYPELISERIFVLRSHLTCIVNDFIEFG